MPSNEDVTLLDDSLATETIDLNLDDFAEESGGAWGKGWYASEIIEGYQTKKGKVIQTEDTPSQDGSSRNLRLCFRVKNGSDERTMNTSFNYRPTDFTPERLAHIKSLRTDNKGVSGRWSDSDAQRSSLALAKVGGLTKALGFSLKLTADNRIVASPFVGQSVDVYLSIDQNGYNEVKHFAVSGAKTGTYGKRGA